MLSNPLANNVLRFICSPLRVSRLSHALVSETRACGFKSLHLNQSHLKPTKKQVGSTILGSFINNRTITTAIICDTPMSAVIKEAADGETTESESQLKTSPSVPAKSRPASGDDLLLGLDLEENQTELEALRSSYEAGKNETASKWLEYANSCHIYLHRGGGEPSDAIAAFDLDGTLIRPKSNKRIPKSATDWDLLSVWTKVKLQQALRDNKARFVIFTNQNGVGLKLVPLAEVQERIELVSKRLNIACTVLVATEKDVFRKPRTGMYKLFQRAFNGTAEVNLEKSFYCGDAIGYPAHSDADIKFAQNIAMPFVAADKFLRGVKPKIIVDPQQAESTKQT